MHLSSLFERPLLIYDDKCYSCMKFAKAASALSRGWIRTAGHFYSDEARKAKRLVFPNDYDPTVMSWLINKKGAHGARSALAPIVAEIIRGMFTGPRDRNQDQFIERCEYSADGTMGGSPCNTPGGIARRLVNMIRTSGHFDFPPDRETS